MALTDAMVALYSTTLAAATSSVSIVAIPTTGYRDLRLVMSVTNSTSPSNVYAKYNGDGGANYATVYMKGNGSTASSGGGSSNTVDYIGVAYTSGPDTITVDIFDYAQTDKHKSILARYGDAGGEGAVARANRWASTAAISSIQIAVDGNNFAAGSTFELFGIKA